MDPATEIRAMGATFSPELIHRTQALYAGRVLKPADVGAAVERDIAYGPDARHRLDLFRPASGAEPKAAILFVHGGGFVMGDKGGPDAAFHNHIGAWAVKHGLAGATITYRLAPTSPWPAGSEDVARATDHLAGMLPAGSAIFVMGQSAGATHVAGYLADPKLGAAQRIAGAVMLSGLYDAQAADPNPFKTAYYGSDESRYASQSTIAALAAADVPCLFSVSELDPPDFQRQARLLVDARMAARGAWPRMLYLTDHNHISSVLQLGAPEDRLGPELLRFMQQFKPAWIGV